MTMRSSFWHVGLLLVLMTLGCDGRRVPVTEFDQGFNQGVETVRDIRQKHGAVGEFSLKAVGEVGFIPPDAKKTADWNAGFRQGMKSELKR